jgi:lipopolysaccharide heptosyltransferase I
MKILIIRVSAIGDVIHTLPALFLLKKQIPHAQISWIVQKKAAALLAHHPALDRVWVLPDKYLYPAQWKTTAQIMREVKTTKWDAIIDFQGILKTSVLIAQLKGKKYGFAKEHARDPWTRFFTHHHVNPQYTNIIQKNLALAAHVVHDLTQQPSCPALHVLRQDFDLFFSDHSKELVAKWLAQHHAQKIIALCPNTTWASKLWPTERWQELLKLLCSNFNKPGDPIITLLGTSFTGEAAEKLLPFIKKHNLPVIIVPRMDLLTTAYLFTHATLVIAPDTGLLHIADFLGVNSLGIFGPTSKRRHGPFLTEANVRNCIQIECPHHYQKTHGKNTNTIPEQNCMYRLLSQEVLNKVVGITQGA